MRPDQCGTGRRVDTLHPGDRAQIELFAAWLTTGAVHIKAVRAIRTGAADHRLQRQLLPGPPYHVDDLVKIMDGPHRGRWGQVVHVHDFRNTHPAAQMEFLVMVSLKAWRDREIVAHPPGPQPFEPHELAHLYSGEGDWTRKGRVVRRDYWPRPRTGVSDAS